MQSQEWFSNWFNSHYYHLLYNNRDEIEANTFISKIIHYLKPLPNSRMLDVACGKGRHSKALSEMGFDVIGIDLSEESIKEAKLSESRQLHFYKHDMRLPFYINYFDIVFNLFTSFGYFRTQREHNNAIRSITQGIKQNGILVIDYLNTHFEENNFTSSIEKEIDKLKFIITKWQTETHFYKQIQVADSTNGLPRHLSTERVAKFSLGDFNEMLSLQNMQIQQVFGDYNLNEYHINTSPRMIILAKKVS
ncbi:MAG: class I SAM-dependent methyltransferase [Bacteroidetes bacterium]|nr:class I SAM-dependent methyltransferase [Bacteroidota bacterium]